MQRLNAAIFLWTLLWAKLPEIFLGSRYDLSRASSWGPDTKLTDKMTILEEQSPSALLPIPSREDQTDNGKS